MRVMCIDQAEKTYNSDGQLLSFDGTVPVVGQVYTVVREERKFDYLWYKLEEFPSTYSFNAELFAPLSDIDEAELVNTIPELATA